MGKETKDELEQLLDDNENNVLTRQLIKEIMKIVEKNCGCFPEAKVWCEKHYREMFTDMEATI